MCGEQRGRFLREPVRRGWYFVRRNRCCLCAVVWLYFVRWRARGRLVRVPAPDFVHRGRVDRAGRGSGACGLILLPYNKARAGHFLGGRYARICGKGGFFIPPGSRARLDLILLPVTKEGERSIQ